MRTYLEDFPCLDIGELIRRGVFTEEAGSAVPVLVKNGVVDVQYDSSSRRLKVDGGGRGREIAIIGVAIKHGIRRYFLCPEEFYRTTKLYLKDGRWAARQSHDLRHLSTSGRKRDRERATAQRLEKRLFGTETRGPARGPNRQAIVAKLSDPSLQLHLNKSSRRKLLNEQNRIVLNKKRERTRQNPIFSTAYALASGAAETAKLPWLDVVKRYDDILKIESDWSLPRFDLNDFAPPLAIEAPDTFPRLDIRSLVKAGYFRPNQLTMACLAWPLEWTGSLKNIVVMVSWLKPEPFIIVIGRDIIEGRDIHQRIDVEMIDDQLFMRCPLSSRGRRARILYLRNGRFGCKQAQRLKDNPTAAEIAFPR